MNVLESKNHRALKPKIPHRKCASTKRPWRLPGKYGGKVKENMHKVYKGSNEPTKRPRRLPGKYDGKVKRTPRKAVVQDTARK